MSLRKKPTNYKTVWKTVINPDSVKGDECRIPVSAPVGAKPLRVMKQNGVICVWFECDPDNNAKDSFDLYCVGTGFGKVNEKRTYLDTVIDGDCVWHFYH